MVFFETLVTLHIGLGFVWEGAGCVLMEFLVILVTRGGSLRFPVIKLGMQLLRLVFVSLFSLFLSLVTFVELDLETFDEFVLEDVV